MNISELTCIALGILFNIFTFALGCAVGVSMVRTRKDSDNDRNRYEAEGFQYYGGKPSKN
jgi:hypothetical protein